MYSTLSFLRNCVAKQCVSRAWLWKIWACCVLAALLHLAESPPPPGLVSRATQTGVPTFTELEKFIIFACYQYLPFWIWIFFLPFQPQLESLTFLTETLSEESESVVYTLPGLLWLASVNCLGFETHPLVHWINYAICLIRSTNPGQSQTG